MSFHEFRKDFERGFAAMPLTAGKLFKVNLPNDKLWNAYIESFPEKDGIRKSFDCQACRSYLKHFGNVVGIDENYNLVSAWNFQTSAEYQPIVDKLKALVENATIKEVFLPSTHELGVDNNIQYIKGESSIRRYHFHAKLPTSYALTPTVNYSSVNSKYCTKRTSLYRSINEIKFSAIEAVIGLIETNSLYRGAEFKKLLEDFKNIQDQFLKLDSKKIENFTWAYIVQIGYNSPLANLLGTSIGMLLENLSKGTPLDNAVRQFESMIAGPNYKRPTAIVTTKMVDDAKKAFEDAGLATALVRRHALKSDIPITEVIFVNRDTTVSTNIFDMMQEDVLVDPSKIGKCREMTLAEFQEEIIPNATSIELLFEDWQKNNLFNLTTASIEDSERLFKWDNPFSWSYINSVTDSIKERVKQAGGNIDADVRISLSWHNKDDLDLAVIEPTGNKIYFGKRKSTITDGYLDVDMNASMPYSKNPVENITWRDSKKMMPGTYNVQVNNFTRRTNENTGYELEVEIDGTIYKKGVAKSPNNNHTDLVLTFEVTKDKKVQLKTELLSETSVKTNEVWNIHTNKWQKVSMILPSPNHWGGKQIGNKHYFLVLEGINNPDITRSIYNEYVREDLNVHKRAFELLGSKALVPTSDMQLAGVGFSSTRNSVAILRVDGKLYKIKFN